MSLTTHDCKSFISKNAKEKNLPSENWKRISKTKSDEGCVRIFSHKDGYEIEILEKFNSSELEWLNTRETSEIELKKYTFNDLPNSVKLFVNTLRSLMGDKILEENSFDKKHIKIWKETIKHRHAKGKESLPSILIYDTEYTDDAWNILHDSSDDINSWNNDNVLKYVGKYFWFCFSNDPRQEDEPPHLFITPKGFWDDGRIPIMFSDKIENDMLKNLSEIMESTLEFNSEKNDPIDKLRESYEVMKELGVEFSFDLQEYMNSTGYASDDFCDSKWIKENLEKTKKLKMKK